MLRYGGLIKMGSGRELVMNEGRQLSARMLVKSRVQSKLTFPTAYFLIAFYQLQRGNIPVRKFKSILTDFATRKS